MHLGLAQCDWVSFLIEREPDLFQTHYLEEWNTLVVARLPAWAQANQQRVQALGQAKYGKRRYILSLWGESAQQHIHLPFAKWADYLTRYDVKRRLYDIRPDTFERLIVALQFADTRRNVEAFRLPKRTKNTARDSGGQGVRFGSRKSDICTKLSRRGKEVPYFETQIQDDLLDRLVLGALEFALDEYDNVKCWDQLLGSMAEMQENHIRAWFIASGMDKRIEELRHEDIPMPERLKKMFQLDMWADGAPLPEPPAKYTDHNDAWDDTKV